MRFEVKNVVKGQTVYDKGILGIACVRDGTSSGIVMVEGRKI